MLPIWLWCSRDDFDDLVLNREHVSHLAIKLVRPDVGAGFGVDELRSYTGVTAARLMLPSID